MTTIAKTINPKIRLIVTILLLLSTFVSLTSQTMMVTALPAIQEEMQIKLTAAQWLTTGYTLIIGIVTPLSSNLYEKFKNRTLFLGTIGIFFIGTLLGCFATNFLMLLLARLVQACAGGILMTFQMTTMISIYPAEKRGSVLGLSALVVATGPAIGPTLSGIILEYLSWQWLFILFAPIMALILIIGYFVFPNFSQPRHIKIDLLSVLLSLVGSGLALASLTVMTEQLVMGLAMLIVGLCIIFLFVRRQLHLDDPMLKVQLVKRRSFRLMTIVTVMTFMVLLGTEQMLPIFSEGVLQVNSMQSGMMLLPGAVVNAMLAPIIGYLYDNYGPKFLIPTGFLLMVISNIPLMLVTKESSVGLLTLAYSIRLAGNAFCFSPAMSEAFVDVPQADVSHATALNNAIRQTFGAVSVTLMVVFSELSSNLVIGTRIAFTFSALLMVTYLITFILYMKKRTA